MTTPIDTKADIYLHIGTMKSGTSYIQAILRRNKRLLGRDGYLIPRTLVPAVVDVLGRRGVSKEMPIEGAWERFLNSVEAWDGRGVIASQEFLSGATAEEAQRVVDWLPKGQAKVVITNRDLLRVIPSHWQTVVKNGGTWPFPEYVRLLLESPGPDGGEHRYSRGFWRHHDVAQIVDNWASAVGIENVTLVTVPPSGAPGGLLWQRFCEAVGIQPEHYDDQMNAKSNISLTYSETEMLREVNMRVRKPLGPLEYRILVNKYLANKLLRKAPESGKEPDRPTLGAESHTKIHQRAEALIEGVTASGVRVIGDIDDLRVQPYSGDGEAGDSTGPQNRIPESVPNAIARLVLRIARLERDIPAGGNGGATARAANKSAGTKAAAPTGGTSGKAAGSGSGATGGGRPTAGKAAASKGPSAKKAAGKRAVGAKKTPAQKKAAAAKRAAKKAASARDDAEADFESFENLEGAVYDEVAFEDEELAELGDSR
jgi:hypothetical protein